MKWWLLIILSLSLAFLGCEKTDQPTINEDGTKDNGKLESGGKILNLKPVCGLLIGTMQ